MGLPALPQSCHMWSSSLSSAQGALLRSAPPLRVTAPPHEDSNRKRSRIVLSVYLPAIPDRPQPQVQDMAVVTAPLLSFSASGQIAKTQVYSRWKGRPYVRRLVVPSNPRSTEQTKTRNTFTFLSNVWRVAPGDVRAPWAAYAKGLVMTDRNAFMKQNIGNLRDQLDLTGMILSPGAAGGLAVVPTITGGVGTITVAMAAPDPLPPGWSIVAAVGAAILDQDPTAATSFLVTAGTDLTDPYSVVLAGMDAGDYQAAGWFVYQRSASLTDLAYGPGPTEPVTVT